MIRHSRERGIRSTLTNFYIPVDTERAIRERDGITWFKEHRREKCETIVMYGMRERLNDIWFVFGILKFAISFSNFIGVTWIL
jgi:hypothetical protein